VAAIPTTGRAAAATTRKQFEMSKRSQKRQGAQDDYRQVVSEVAAAIERYVTSEEWERLKDLRWMVGKWRCREAQIAWRGKVNGQDRILTDAVAQLVQSGRCELRGEGAEAEVRLRPPGSAGDAPPDHDQDSTPPADDLPRDTDSERKRCAARLVGRISPELGDRVLAGEVSLHEALRELREAGQLPPARAPKFDRGVEAGCPPEPAPAHSPAAGSDHTGAAVGLPFESGKALADALVAAVGAGRALELLREATAAIEASRGRHEADGAVAANGGPTEESVPLPACEEPGGEKEAADPAEDRLAAATQPVPEPCGQAAQTEEG
jgi:hypothetical protein